MSTAMGGCFIKLPRAEDLALAVEVLNRLYPDDYIYIRDPGILDSVAGASVNAFIYSEGMPCRERLVYALSTLFYEVVSQHPLVDGNKRLAVLVLVAALRANALPEPGPHELCSIALKASKGEAFIEDVYYLLLSTFKRIA